MIQNVKIAMVLLFTMLCGCCLIELFNQHNSETAVMTLLVSFNVSAILAYLFLRWAK
jgi:hypothetical protein